MLRLLVEFVCADACMAWADTNKTSKRVRNKSPNKACEETKIFLILQLDYDSEIHQKT
jgi:hypothetical protein